MRPYIVDLPAGGQLDLQGADEVKMWNDLVAKYVSDYGFVKTNDLVLVGAMVSQTIAMYRAQKDLGDVKKAGEAIARIGKATEQIQMLEKQLGIDKKAREAGGKHTIEDFVTRAKRAAHAKGVRIAERTLAFEAFCMELSWRIRLFQNGDEEDRKHHGISSAEDIIEWAGRELAKIADADKKWAHQKGKVFVGQL